MNLDRRPWIRAFSYPSDPGIMALCRFHKTDPTAETEMRPICRQSSSKASWQARLTLAASRFALIL